MFSIVTDVWNNGLESGGRRPRLLAIKRDGEVVEFAGESIPGVLAITGEQYEQNGKWSNTTYWLRTAKGVDLVQSLTALHQEPFADFASWREVAAAVESLIVRPVDGHSLRAVIHSTYGRWAEKLDERAAAVASLNSEFNNEPADVVLSAFSPNMLSTADGPVGVRFTRISLDEAAELAAGAPSAVGHESTAAVFSEQLGTLVEFNRVTATLQSGAVALVGQYRGPRLAEGATSLPEGATIEWLKVEVL